MIGQKIGNYEITSLIGQGGMGLVYLAEHPLIGSKVAIKVLHEEQGKNPEIVSRFFTEARSVNEIRHPNIVKISDFGEVDGRSYIVMELLEGESLSERIESVGRLEEPVAASIAERVASALVAAHAQGIIHRDLKPENIFLADNNGNEEIKVLDFGIAKLTGEPLQSAHKTQTGAMMGTPLYMSPEQCLGKKDVDERTDIYALGVVLYQMVVGALPFDAETLGEIIVAHTHQAPPPPRERNPGLSIQIEEIILCAMAKDRYQRFGSMEEMRTALLGVAESRADTPTAFRVTPPLQLIDSPGEAWSPPTATPQPTTLSSAAQSRESVHLAPRGGRRNLLLAGVGVATVAAIVIAATMGSSNEVSSASAPSDPVDNPVAVVTTDAAPAAVVPSTDAAVVASDPPPAVPPVRLVAKPIATAYVGDREIGKTPVLVEVPGDGAEVEVVLRHPKYKDKMVKLSAGGKATVSVTLERNQRKPPKKPPPKKPPPKKPPPKKPPKDSFNIQPIE